MSRPLTALGYTLLEVLVVVLITGIMTGVVIFNLGSDSNADPDKQLRRLAGLVEHWCQRSILEGRSLGIRITASGYDFWVPDSLAENASNSSEQSLWQTVTTEPAFAQHEWADSLQVEVLLQGQLAPLDSEQPQLLCFASSELTPFVINLRLAGESAARLEGDLNGQLKLFEHDR